MTGEPQPLPLSLLTAEALIAWRGGLPGGVPESVILTHQESLFRALAPRLRAKRIAGLFPQLRILAGTDARLGLAGGIGIGGPATAMAVEELAAAGVKRIIMVDIAAAISFGCGEGDAIIVLDAIAADGTSQHYLGEGEALVRGDDRLITSLAAAMKDIRVQRGRVASTDAPFRETAALLEGFRAKEAIAVDMETAAFYASAAAVGVQAAAVLVVGDSLTGSWQPPSNPAAIRAKLLQVAGIVRQVLLA